MVITQTESTWFSYIKIYMLNTGPIVRKKATIDVEKLTSTTSAFK